jgi:hypothetical protein
MTNYTEDEMYRHLSSKAQIKRLLRAMGQVRIDTGIHPELRAVARKVWSRPKIRRCSHSGDKNAVSDARSPRRSRPTPASFG